MTREIEVDLSYLTCKRLRAIEDKLKALDEGAWEAACDDLPKDWLRVLQRRAVPPGATLAEVAGKFHCTIDQVRYRQMQGLLALVKKFQEMSGITVNVKCYRNQR